MKKKISWQFYAMTIPFIILFFLLHTYPFIQGLLHSFTNWKGYGDWDFVGLRNYLHLFQDKNILSSYLFTFKFAITATILVNVIGLLLALAMNSKIKFKNLIRGIYFIPFILGTLIVSFIFNYIFGNVIPDLGNFLNVDVLKTNILGTNNAWIGILIVTVWQSVAFNTLIYLAGLQTMDRDIYEAAEIDGASKVNMFTKITFPLLAPFLTINMILSAKGFLMAFDQIIAMTNGGPGTITTTISVLIYQQGFNGAQFAYQSANAVLLFVVVVAISVIQLRFFEKREDNLQ